jgi:hypothetical protein
MVFLDMAPDVRKEKGRRGATSCTDCIRAAEAGATAEDFGSAAFAANAFFFALAMSSITPRETGVCV